MARPLHINRLIGRLIGRLAVALVALAAGVPVAAATLAEAGVRCGAAGRLAGAAVDGRVRRRLRAGRGVRVIGRPGVAGSAMAATRARCCAGRG